MHPYVRPPLAALTLAALGALIACGAATARPTEPRETTDGGNVTVTEAASVTPTATATATGPVTNACPASFADAQRRGECVIGSSPSCRYAEGACTCNQFPSCGGMMRALAPPGSPGMWSCGSTDPRVLDPAGCAYVPPQDGASCASDGKRCAYGPCSWSQTVATCQAGTWHVTVYRGPPPP